MFTSDDLLDVLKALRGGAKSKGARSLDRVPPCRSPAPAGIPRIGHCIPSCTPGIRGRSGKGTAGMRPSACSASFSRIG